MKNGDQVFRREYIYPKILGGGGGDYIQVSGGLISISTVRTFELPAEYAINNLFFPLSYPAIYALITPRILGGGG